MISRNRFGYAQVTAFFAFSAVKLSFACISVFLCFPPSALSAQFAIGTDLSYRSEYVWRGLTRSSGSVFQPALFAAFEPRGWTFTAGAWANVELFSADANDLSDADPGDRLTELDYWAEAHTRLKDFDLRAGITRYDFQAPTNNGIHHRLDTTELYAAIGHLFTDHFQLGVFGAFDVDAFDGAYVALQALRNFPVVEFHGWLAALQLDAETGVSFGQEVDAEQPLEPAHFEAGGVTHLRGGATVRVHNHRLAPYFSLQLQSNGDTLTRLATASSSGSHKLWIEAGVSVMLGSRAIGQR